MKIIEYIEQNFIMIFMSLLFIFVFFVLIFVMFINYEQNKITTEMCGHKAIQRSEFYYCDGRPIVCVDFTCDWVVYKVENETRTTD